MMQIYENIFIRKKPITLFSQEKPAYNHHGDMPRLEWRKDGRTDKLSAAPPPTLKGRRGSALPPPYLRPSSALQGEEKAVEKWTLKGTWTRLERAFAAKMADMGKGRDNR